jgi:hypothetical protein
MLTVTPNVKPADVARAIWQTMDDVYTGELEESQVTAALSDMFDYVLPHFAALEPMLQEQVANAAEWLDRLGDLPE